MDEQEGITSRPPDAWRGEASDQRTGQVRGDEIAASTPPPSQPGAAEPVGAGTGWFVMYQGTPIGPFTPEELRANAAAGTLSGEDLVRQGNGSWMPAKEVPFLEGRYRGGGGAAPAGPEGGRAVAVGIGGWLLLPAIGLVLGLLAMAWAIYQDLTLAGDGRVAAIPGFRTALEVEISLNVGLILYQGYVTFAFFGRKHRTPVLMIFLLLLHVITRLIDGAVVSVLVGPSPAVALTVIRPVAAAFCWIPYFMLSRRVAATFVN